MRKQLENYHYLAGSSRSGGTLWAGPDHLLYIENTGFLFSFSESYRRIDYTKVQTLSYGKTSRWAVLTVCWFLLSLLCAVVGFFSTQGLLQLFPERNGALISPLLVAAVCSIPWLVVLLVHLARGPTCVCKLQTAVQVLRLRPLRRLRSAVPVIAQVMEICQRHQGGEALTTEAVLAASAAGDQMDALSDLIKPPFAGSKLLLVGLPLMVLSSVLTIADVFVDSFALFTVMAAIGVSATALCIGGLTRSLRLEVPTALRVSLWGLIGDLLFGIIIGLIMQGAFTASTIGGAKAGHLELSTQLGMMQWMAKVSFTNYPVIAWLVVANGVLGIFFSLLGLPTVLRPPGRAPENLPETSPSPQPPAA